VNPSTHKKLLDLNRRFYSQYAAEFSGTRQQSWQGWRRILDRFEGRPGISILDLGCGNGRFAAASDRQLTAAVDYVGVDASAELIEEASWRLEDLDSVTFDVAVADVLSPRAPVWSGRQFDLVVLFGLLHHVPGAKRRAQLLSRAAKRVAPGGLMAVSFWQLGESERLMSRTIDPKEIGLTKKSLEEGDHLLKWGEREAVRYCHHSTPEEAADLVDAVGLPGIETYRADGKDGQMNLYWLLQAPD